MALAAVPEHDLRRFCDGRTAALVDARLRVCVGHRCWWWSAWHRVQTPWWDNAGDLREMQDNMVTDVGYEGTDEYTPVGADPASIDKDARKVRVDGPAHAAIRV